MVAASFIAVGTSFTGFTVTMISAVLEKNPSNTVYANDCKPLKLALGVNVTELIVDVAIPLVGLFTAVILRVSASSCSISLLSAATTIVPSSFMDTASLTGIGGSLTDVTVTVTVVDALLSNPSVAV